MNACNRKSRESPLKNAWASGVGLAVSLLPLPAIVVAFSPKFKFKQPKQAPRASKNERKDFMADPAVVPAPDSAANSLPAPPAPGSAAAAVNALVAANMPHFSRCLCGHTHLCPLTPAVHAALVRWLTYRQGVTGVSALLALSLAVFAPLSRTHGNTLSNTHGNINRDIFFDLHLGQSEHFRKQQRRLRARPKCKGGTLGVDRKKKS
ncbi:hypothetical protein B0T24DRAFT_600103 [Lasiosphaeria ovina]|uniref:Uncharacterized protein n=1 Tax=Lasiosphaeria ovina TaxID=92902 RepID=A0AAE0MXC1_9PEZI|nr:hypothetical protein B0T24DRAFT_600103 [Lasiosphaeria ovina]